MAGLDAVKSLSLGDADDDQTGENIYETLIRDNSRDVVALTEREHHVLDLYDSLQELELECGLMEAQTTVQPGDLDVPAGAWYFQLIRNGFQR